MPSADQRLAKLLMRAQKRIEDRKDSYEKLSAKEKDVRKKIKDSKVPPAKKRQLYSSLKDLQGSMLDVIDAQTELVDAEQLLIEALVDHKIAICTLDRVLGRTLRKEIPD